MQLSAHLSLPATRVVLFVCAWALLLSSCGQMSGGATGRNPEDSNTEQGATDEPVGSSVPGDETGASGDDGEVDDTDENGTDVGDSDDEDQPTCDEELCSGVCCDDVCIEDATACDDCGGCPANSVCVDGACGCEEGFFDCDQDPSNGCESTGGCVCEFGETRSCYYGPVGTLDVGVCAGGLETCMGTGWSICEGQVFPEFETCEPDGLDNDCDGVTDEDEDFDGDGWTRCGGDCCDHPSQQCAENPALVNPGAYDFPGNMLDDDCNGVEDDAPTDSCSDWAVTSGTTADHMVRAMDLCQFTLGDPDIWGVTEAQLLQSNGTGAPQDIQVGVLESLGSVVSSVHNTTMAVISSGEGRGVGDPGHTGATGYVATGGPITPPQSYLSSHGGLLQTSSGCPSSETNIYDSAMLRVKLRVPTNAQGFEFSFRFFSHEYPVYLCTQFNDFFLALLSSSHPDIPADGNISFDTAGNPVSVNNAFFTSCEPISCNNWDVLLGGGPDNNSDGCVDALTCNASTNQCESSLGACPDGSSDVSAYNTNTADAGATGWLTTSAPVVPGEEITLEFHIWDTGDTAFDSLAILDHFRWKIDPTEVATKN